MNKKTVNFILAGISGTVTVLALTIAIYATFFHDFLGQFLELSEETIALVSRDPVKVFPMLMANVAHGFLMATVISWGKFYKLREGAKAGAIIAFLTEMYFCFSQYAIMKTMSIQSAVIDTVMWTAVNSVVGIVVAFILRRNEKPKQ